jgi:hypothetical protein
VYRAAANPRIGAENLGRGIAIRCFVATRPPLGENPIYGVRVDVTLHSDARQTAVFQEALGGAAGPENYFVTPR